MPIVIHCRDAFDEVFEVLETEKGDDLYGIFHCFSGTEAQAHKAISFNMKLGIGGVVTFKNGKISEFEFTRTDLNISNYGSSTISYKKTDDNSTADLIRCSLLFNNSINNSGIKEIREINNCTFANLENIYQLLYSRLIKPLYTTFLIAISLLIILKSKSDHTFNIYSLANKWFYLYHFFRIFFKIYKYEYSAKFFFINVAIYLDVAYLLIFFSNLKGW